MNQADRDHLRNLLAIHRQRLDLFERRVKAYGSREKMPIADQIEMENDEKKIKELERKLGA